jgi:putative transposase
LILLLMRGFFMPNYRHNFVAGGCYFFTVNLLERQGSLLTDHIDLLRDSVRRVKRLYPFHIDAWVALPDHMHCARMLCRPTQMIFRCAGG